MIDSDTVKSLNSLLSGEIAAAQSYRQAIEKIQEISIKNQLEQLELSHAQRVQRLRNRIRQIGGDPVVDSGLWGGFAQMLESGAVVFGVGAALNVLEQGENQGLNSYKDALRSLDPESGRLIERELLPEQEKTRGTIGTLKRNLTAQ